VPHGLAYVPQVLKHVGRPDAILFVPVAGEFDETLVVRLLTTFYTRPFLTPDIFSFSFNIIDISIIYLY
jgi:hypothetical protein